MTDEPTNVIAFARARRRIELAPRRAGVLRLRTYAVEGDVTRWRTNMVRNVRTRRGVPSNLATPPATGTPHDDIYTARGV